ncbi:MAG: terminase, partial [Alphaproteobacteria bacterium]|nr:terminase [Alphaproteobacteria bacterium]
PAIAEEEREYRIGTFAKFRKAGEVLHPEREDARMLDELKRELGSRAFASQYQQRPVPQDGEMVRREWFRRHSTPPETFSRIVQSWDTGIKVGAAHDPSVCITFGEKDGEAFVLDVTVVRAEYPDLRRMVTRTAREYGADVVLMEDKASGQSLIQDIRWQGEGVPVVPVMPVQDKVTRFAAISAMIEAGMVSVPVEAVWLAAFETEVMGFPNARHDDQVDALSQYLNWRRGRKPPKYRIRTL